MIEVQGHRGARAQRPENTLPSFEAALDAGVDSIETDLQLSRDGVWILFHDSQLDPAICSFPSAERRVRSLSAATVQQVIADRNPDPVRFSEQAAIRPPFSVDFAGQHFFTRNCYAIPTVRHLFSFVKAYAQKEPQREHAGRVILDLEIKSEPFASAPFPIGSLERLADLIIELEMTHCCRVRSFDHRIVKRFKQLLPELATGILIAGMAPVDPVRLAVDADANFYCPEYRFLDSEQVGRLKKEDIGILPWTVNAPEEWQCLIEWGVDGITTDDPARLIEWLQ